MALNNRIIPMTWAVRTKVEPFSLSAAIVGAIQSVNRDLPVAHIRSMNQVVVQSTARDDFNMLLLTIFAAVAPATRGDRHLRADGILGAATDAGDRHSHRFGASPRDMRKMVVYQGMQLALIGVGIGLAGAFGLTRLMASLLFGVKTSDPLVFASVAVLLSGVAFVATYFPARRATRVDPMVALRYE